MVILVSDSNHETEVHSKTAGIMDIIRASFAMHTRVHKFTANPGFAVSRHDECFIVRVHSIVFGCKQ